MSNTIQFTLIVGGIYEVQGKSGKVVRFKFVHANSGKATVEIGGTQKEVDSIPGLIAPDEFQGLYVVDAPTHF
jgi:hypothetical protein